MKIICIGDNVCDHYINQNKYYPGGNCVNVAVSLKRNGIKYVEYIGVFGNDDKAEHIKKSIDKEGIIYSRSRKVFGTTGFPKVEITDSGDRKFVGGPKNTVQHTLTIRMTDEELKYLDSFSLCHTSCYSSFDHQLTRIYGHTPISYDFSENYSDDILNRVSPFLKFAFFSGSKLTLNDIHVLINKVISLGVSVVCVTLGEAGSVAADKNGMYKYGIYTVQKMVDAMGTGDSFIGGFISEYLKTNDIKKSLEQGALSASKTCSEEGAFGYPMKC